MVTLLQTPSVEIASHSWARSLLAPSRSVREPLGLAAWGGFADLRKHLLPEGDMEVRVWGGFGLSNLGGLILRRRSGVWGATRLIGGFDEAKYPSSKILYAAPQRGWPIFWRKADALGLWTLPDASTLPQKDRRWVTDGFSYLVELQRDGRYRAYAYMNPEFQKQWPQAAKMEALGRLLNAEFPVPAVRPKTR